MRVKAVHVNHNIRFTELAISRPSCDFKIWSVLLKITSVARDSLEIRPIWGDYLCYSSSTLGLLHVVFCGS